MLLDLRGRDVTPVSTARDMWGSEALTSIEIHTHKSRFAEGQIVGILDGLKADAKPRALSCTYGISETTLYNGDRSSPALRPRRQSNGHYWALGNDLVTDYTLGSTAKRP